MDVFFLTCVLVFTVVAAWFDLRTKKLPNLLTVPVFVAGFTFAVARGALASGTPGALHGGLFSLGGFAIGFGVLFILWLIGGGGGGDVKFMGALGAWLGVTMTVQVLFLSALVAGMLSIGVLLVQTFRTGLGRVQRRYGAGSRSHGASRPKNTESARQERAVRRRLMPFAVPAALATWTVLIVTHFVSR